MMNARWFAAATTPETHGQSHNPLWGTDATDAGRSMRASLLQRSGCGPRCRGGDVDQPSATMRMRSWPSYFLPFETMTGPTCFLYLGVLLRLGLYLGPAPALRVGNLFACFGAQDPLLTGFGFGGRFLRATLGDGSCGSERGQQRACLLQPGYLGVNSCKDVFDCHT